MFPEVEERTVAAVRASPEEIRAELKRFRLYDLMQVGFDLYGTDRAESEHHDDAPPTAIEKYEGKSCETFMEYCDSHPLSTPGGLYLQRLRQVSTSFARSIGSARRILLSKRKFATEVRAQAQTREAVVIGWEAIGRLALQLLMIGGVFGVASHLLLGKMEVSSGTSQILMSVAIAFASMLFGMSKQLRDISRAQNKIDAQYYAALDHAKEKQCDRMEAALRRAAQGFTMAYTEYFGEEPSDSTLSIGLELDIIASLRSQNDPMCTNKEPLGLLGVFKAISSTLKRKPSGTK
jgi:hypothetical protein